MIKMPELYPKESHEFIGETMMIRKAFKFELMPNGAQIRKMKQFCGCSRQNTSRCCPACGHTAKDNRQTQALFECVDCGYQNNADVVGAINVLNRGQEILAAQ